MSIQSRLARPRVDTAHSPDAHPDLRLERFVDDVERLSPNSLGAGSLGAWRGAALQGLTDVREVLVDEAPACAPHVERGTVLLRERTGLLDRISVLRLQVLGMEEVDRLSYDVRRLVADVRAHLAHLPAAESSQEKARAGSGWERREH